MARTRCVCWPRSAFVSSAFVFFGTKIAPDALLQEREVFASLIVKDGEVISLAVNMVLKRRDATATSEVLAIRKAAKRLKTYNLSGCKIYSSMEPDVMSFGAVLWARLDELYYGLSQKDAAHYGCSICASSYLLRRRLHVERCNLQGQGLLAFYGLSTVPYSTFT